MAVDLSLYDIRKSSGRRGYEWRCPKGYVYYNYITEQEAREAAEEHAKRKQNE